MSAEVEPFHLEEISGDARATWDRLDGEALSDFRLFRRYLDAGPGRSIRALVDDSLTLARLHGLSSRNSWVVRAKEFDAEVVRIALAELEGEGVAMRARHAENAKKILAKAMDAVEHIDPRFLIPRDIPVWIDVASKLERTSRGVQEAKRIELTGAGGGPIEVANNLAADDRRALLAAINEQIANRLSPPAIEGVIDAEVIEDHGDGEE